ncbi:MAG: CoB--CoM heterodisulfide reductase iron-sulfur subunit B family protein [Deltaproteobacteria bacterium]|nr:CoB--CoM heterodisulfide reductase iron-sulfur subunit B family protein [Deltaproteobacteria bacterium]
MSRAQGIDRMDFSYFPGCSLATTCTESNQSLMQAAKALGFNLIELPDWNCCGSSSAQTMCKNLSLGMAARNLSLAPAGRPLVAMCPRCLHYLRSARECLKADPERRRELEESFGRPINVDIEIIHFLEVLVRYGLDRLSADAKRSLKGLKFVPYYGCTLFRPPRLEKDRYFQGEMENVLKALGAESVPNALSYRCCGSFLSATDPEIVAPLVNEIIDSAAAAKADCLITACAMCQLNLEIRNTRKTRLPIFHFSEILALALGAEDYEKWFVRHIVDPRPVIRKLAKAA